MFIFHDKYSDITCDYTTYSELCSPHAHLFVPTSFGFITGGCWWTLLRCTSEYYWMPRWTFSWSMGCWRRGGCVLDIVVEELKSRELEMVHHLSYDLSSIYHNVN